MTPDDDAPPWTQPAPPAGRDPEAWRRYQRAGRLTQFARDLERGPGVMMSEAQLAYRRACLERWEEYLAGWAPPPPKQGGGRPPRL